MSWDLGKGSKENRGAWSRALATPETASPRQNACDRVLDYGAVATVIHLYVHAPKDADRDAGRNKALHLQILRHLRKAPSQRGWGLEISDEAESEVSADDCASLKATATVIRVA
jgi:hypothetical protein